jgi:hypothetical protein
MAALRELHAYLDAQGVPGNAREVGAAILALARARGWNEDSQPVRDWLEELALEVAKNVPVGEPEGSAPASQSEIDTVPLSELRKMLKRNSSAQPKSDPKQSP